MLLRATLLLLLFSCGARTEAQEAAATPDSTAIERDPDLFKRRHASGQYVDPDSRFSLQGYVTGTFADFQEDFLKNDFGAPGQLLVPQTDKSSFQYDWAMFLGSKLSDNVRFVVETHFTPKGDGDFHPDIVTTEARVTWLPLRDKHAFRLSLGQYWAPFAGVNEDWFSAVNLFATVPFAARAFPLHYNERGVEAEGEFDLGGKRGFNYVVSLGNGVSGMTVADQKGIDANNNKTVMGRIGFFPAGPSFELGLSGVKGDFREALASEFAASDPRRYPASFSAGAADARFRRPSLELRAYAIRSTEELDGAPNLDRWGTMAEGTVRVARGVAAVREVWLKARWDLSRVETLAGPAQKDQVFSVGINFKPARRTVLKIEGFFHEEKDQRSLRDNGVVAQFSASF